MGYGTASNMKFAVDSNEIALDVALIWHLTSNHYPPVPECFVSVAKDAINRANCDEWDELVLFPEGLFINGQSAMTAREIVGHMHLDAYIEMEAI